VGREFRFNGSMRCEGVALTVALMPQGSLLCRRFHYKRKMPVADLFIACVALGLSLATGVASIAHVGTEVSKIEAGFGKGGSHRSLLSRRHFVAPLNATVDGKQVVNLGRLFGRDATSADAKGHSTDSQLVGAWPTLFILGTQKAATSSLWGLLEQHPRVCPAQLLAGTSNNKELHYFDSTPLSTHGKGIRAYLNHFRAPQCRNKWSRFMDATPSYLRDPVTPQMMFSEMPPGVRARARFIVILREPIARDVSFFNHIMSTRKYPFQSPGFLPVRTYADYVSQQGTLLATGRTSWFSTGFYDEQLNRWWLKWNRKSFLIINFQELISNTPFVVQRITAFLGLKPGPILGRPLPHDNEMQYYGKVDVEDVDCVTRANMAQVYAGHNANLYHMLQQRLASGQAPPQQRPFAHFKLPLCPR